MRNPIISYSKISEDRENSIDQQISHQMNDMRSSIEPPFSQACEEVNPSPPGSHFLQTIMEYGQLTATIRISLGSSLTSGSTTSENVGFYFCNFVTTEDCGDFTKTTTDTGWEQDPGPTRCDSDASMILIEDKIFHYLNSELCNYWVMNIWIAWEWSGIFSSFDGIVSANDKSVIYCRLRCCSI